MKKGLLFIVIVLIGFVFIARLFYLQILDNKYKVPSLQNSTIKIKYKYPERGYIYDRNGELLVSNQLSYDIMIIPREVEPLDTLEFCNLLNISKEDFITKFKRAKNYSPRIPSTFVSQVSKIDYAYLQEKMYK